MSHNELRRKLSSLAQRFVDDVLDAIRSFPLQELATTGLGGRGKGAPARERRGEGGSRKEAGQGRRGSHEIGKLREQIVEVLRQAGGPLGAAEIARQIGGVRSADLQFPMRQLREQQRVQARGNRTQTVYFVSDAAPEASAPSPRASRRPPAPAGTSAGGKKPLYSATSQGRKSNKPRKR